MAKTLKKPSEAEIMGSVLLRVMRDHSEDLHNEPWHTGLEIEIWDAVLAGESGDTKHFYTAHMFRHLATKAGGWWMWDDAQERPVFLPKRMWLKAYAELKRIQAEAAAKRPVRAPSAEV